MATFVLVHGAWGGAWEWRRVARVLRARGHEVFTPTLTGLGERAHLARADVDLDTHIEDVLAVLEFEDLTGVVLCGHSSAGMVITGVMDRAPEQITHGVYVDALVPRDGQTLVDLLPAAAAERILGTERSEDWLVPMPFRSEELGMAPEDAAWYVSKAVPQPLQTFVQPIALGERWTSVPAFTYIHCTERPDYVTASEDDDASASFLATFARRAKERGWRYREIRSGHDPHITAPEQLATLLEEAAASG